MMRFYNLEEKLTQYLDKNEGINWRNSGNWWIKLVIKLYGFAGFSSMIRVDRGN